MQRAGLIILLFLSGFSTARSQITLDSGYFKVQHDKNGKPIYLSRQMIVGFYPRAMDHPFYDGTEQVYDSLSHFLTAPAFEMITAVPVCKALKTAIASKVYCSMHTYDTLSIHLSTGDTVRIPDFWATLLVYLPLKDTTPIELICEALTKNFYGRLVELAHPNYLYHIDVGSQEIEESHRLVLYPNPAQDELHITSQDASFPISYTVYSIAGQLVKTGTLNTAQDTIQTLQMQNGTYFLAIGNRIYHFCVSN